MVTSPSQVIVSPKTLCKVKGWSFLTEGVRKRSLRALLNMFIQAESALSNWRLVLNTFKAIKRKLLLPDVTSKNLNFDRKITLYLCREGLAKIPYKDARILWKAPSS